MYGLDVTYDFINRFRTGEMPIGIADFISTYNQLSVFAPEIRGKWSFTVVPGTRQADGSIRHTVSAAVSCSIALSNTKYPDACWEFLKWWTNTEVQLEYGRELRVLSNWFSLRISKRTGCCPVCMARQDYKT